MARRLLHALLGALLLGGCGTEGTGLGSVSSTPEDPAVPVDGDTLVVAVPYDPGPLDGTRSPLGLSAAIVEQIQPGLVRRGFVHGQVSFEPMLAESFEIGDTSATYTLREGLVWHDGTPLTAADAAFTWSRIADPATRSPYRSDARVIGGVEAKDDRTVAVEFEAPSRAAILQGFGARPVVPRHSADSGWPLASGPFRVERWDEGDLLVLAANESAPAALRPRLDRVVFDVIPSYEDRLSALRRGRADVITGLSVHDAATVNADEGMKLVRRPAASVLYVGYDLADPRFSDVRVRQALTMSLDRERLIRDLYITGGQTYGTYATGTISPALEGWFARDVLPLPYDPAGAIERLTRAGWGDANRDGVRDRRGEPFAFTLLVQGGSRNLDKVTDLLVAWWGSIGVKVTVEHVEPAEMASRVAARDFDAFLWGFPVDPRVDPGVVWRTGAPQNWFGYSSKAVDKALDGSLAATDATEAQKFVREVQHLVYADQPATFLVWQDELAAIDGRFRGVEPDMFSLFRGLERWYVPRAEQRWVDSVPDPRLGLPAPRQ